MMTTFRSLWRADKAGVAITLLASVGVITAGYGTMLALHDYAQQNVGQSICLLLTSFALIGASIFAVEAVEKANK